MSLMCLTDTSNFVTFSTTSIAPPPSEPHEGKLEAIIAKLENRKKSLMEQIE
jgi:hypothetical protein